MFLIASSVMSLIIKFVFLFIILIDIGNCQIFDTCPFGTFYQNGVCLPNAAKIKCPPDTIYKDGVCQYKTGMKCPFGSTYINGVCINQNAPSCFGNSKQCTSTTNCRGNNQNHCPYREICPENYVIFQGSCVSSNIAKCPFGTRLQYGHCINESICPPNSHLENNVCIQDSLDSGIDLSCPFGSHLEGSECVLDPNVICPTGMTFRNKTCSKPCGENSFLIDGTCAQCPANSEYSNGQCVKCKEGMILNNGRCSCPPLKALLNGECVTVNVEKCSEKQMYSNGKCVHRYCFANKCCNTIQCNNCFETCNQIINTTFELSKCHKDCINNILPTIPATPMNIKPNVTLPNLNKVKKPPTVHNISKIVNSTQEHNVITNRNSGNFTEINLGLDGNLLNQQKINDPKEPCCMITDPRKCKDVDGKTVCYHRRRHVCGSECYKRKTTHFHVPASEVHKNIEPDLMPIFNPIPQSQTFFQSKPFFFPQSVQQPMMPPQQIPQYVQPMYVPQTIPKNTLVRQQYPFQQFYQPSFTYPQPSIYSPQSMGSSYYIPNQAFVNPELQYVNQQYPYIQNYQQFQ